VPGRSGSRGRVAVNVRLGLRRRASDRAEGRVVAVADGDTIVLLDLDKHQHKIRVNGIDAPEPKQAFGRRSR